MPTRWTRYCSSRVLSMWPVAEYAIQYRPSRSMTLPVHRRRSSQEPGGPTWRARRQALPCHKVVADRVADEGRAAFERLGEMEHVDGVRVVVREVPGVVHHVVFVGVHGGFWVLGSGCWGLGEGRLFVSLPRRCP